MAGGHKPRSGSLAFYPRVRAKRHFAAFTTYPTIKAETAKPMNFFGYKAGMVQVFGKNAHQKSITFGQETAIPATIIECPPIKIIGARVYGKAAYGIRALGEATVEKPSKNLRRKISAFKKMGNKKKEKKYSTFEELQKLRAKALKVVLLAEGQPEETGMGKKKPDLTEINLTGNVDQQFAFAKEKFGKDLKAEEVFKATDFVDVKAVDKGKGYQGPVKRFGIKIQRPKAKHHRVVGAISPWHPPLVMWTVPRAGQMGYQTRTELNKRILGVESNSKPIAPAGGFSNYGVVKNDYIVLAGSVPGAVKRPVSMRFPVRKIKDTHAKYTDLVFPFATETNEKETKKEETKHAKAEKKEEAKHSEKKAEKNVKEESHSKGESK
ncbi:MAG TPA: 50S ribosomal protein L3 [archaeon]|nr:50S ribosomal protein L3 [archaeon]